MKHKLLITLLCLLTLSFISSANNISVTNISLTGQNTVAGVNNPANYVMVQFTVSWENSWRTSLGPANYDAAWLFIKYRVNGGNWSHANLNNTGQVVPSGSTIEAGLLTPGTAFNSTTNPALGAFIYRSTNGSGTFTATDLQLRWNYGSQGVTDGSPVEVQVFAIEMVYVPQGAFNVGGAGGASAFTSTTINTSNPTVVPSGSGSLGGQAGGFPTGATAPNSLWPNGFAAFYCMKYRITQQQYVDFLNTLTRTQQSARVATNISGTSVTNRYVMSSTSTLLNRSCIRCNATIPAAAPVTFYCDLNGNDIGGESNDGLWIIFNYGTLADVLSYFDWSGLRPMTELEYEKACRGTLLPIAGEYAWGNTIVTANVAPYTNAGTANEQSTTTDANAVFLGSPNDPLRVGIFAKAGTTRTQSGAGYYGSMEMCGSIWERAVNIGTVTGRIFTGIHGNGSLSAAGIYDATNWPDAAGNGAGFKGGSMGFPNTNMVISDRGYADNPDATRAVNYGGAHGVRTQ